MFEERSKPKDFRNIKPGEINDPNNDEFDLLEPLQPGERQLDERRNIKRINREERLLIERFPRSLNRFRS